MLHKKFSDLTDEIALQDGYRYMCPCGELHREIATAQICQSCHDNSMFPGRWVRDIGSGRVVCGEIPSPEELASCILELDRTEAEMKEDDDRWSSAG